MNIVDVLMMFDGFVLMLIVFHPIGETKKNCENTKIVCECGLKSCNLANGHFRLEYFIKLSKCPTKVTTCINLDNNNIGILNSTLVGLFPESLKIVSCQNCNITGISTGELFGNLTNLVFLDLSSNHLEMRALGNLFDAVNNSNLSTLSLSGNQIHDSSQLDFSLLKNIGKLYLNDCSLSNISNILSANSNNTSLERLELGGNQFSEESLEVVYNTSIFYLNLSSLNLSKNPIKTLRPHIFSKFRNLKQLWLSNIQTSEDHFKGIKSETLEFLDVSYSLRLTSGEKYKMVFKVSPKLTYLNLQGVDFNGFRNWTVENLQYLFSSLKLSSLILANTSMKTIPENVFDGLSNLSFLDISRNEISNWSLQCFRNMSTKLVKLDLSNNKIQTIKENTFPHELLVRLEKLRLHGNIFRCDCSIHWFRNWMKGRYLKLDALHSLEEDMSYKCHSPPEVKGLKLVDFDPDYEFCYGIALSVIFGLCIVIFSFSCILVLNLCGERMCKKQMESLKFYD